MLPHSLTNFEIQKYYQNEAKFNGVFSGNNLPKIKNGTYVINFKEFKSIGTYWIALYLNGNNVIYFHSFGFELIPKEIKKLTRNKIIINICRFDNVWILLYWITPIDFMLKGKSLLDYTSYFLLTNIKKMIK